MQHDIRTLRKNLNKQELEAFEKDLRERFALISENAHPVGTKSWLHEWRLLEKEIFGETTC